MKSPTRGVSRRAVLRRCMSALILAGTGMLTTYAAAKEKVSKASAKYRGHPNGGQRCGKCVHYRFPLSCELVKGPVSLFGWCRFFEPD